MIILPSREASQVCRTAQMQRNPGGFIGSAACVIGGGHASLPAASLLWLEDELVGYDIMRDANSKREIIYQIGIPAR